MKYTIDYELHAFYTVNIEADTAEEAVELAERKYYEADFGDAKNIHGEVIRIEPGYPNMMCFAEEPDVCDCEYTCPRYKDCYEEYYKKYWEFMEAK